MMPPHGAIFEEARHFLLACNRLNVGYRLVRFEFAVAVYSGLIWVALDWV